MTAGFELPAGYETLEPFAAVWALGGSGERTAARHTRSIQEIRAFYEAMIDIAPKALEDLSQRKLGELTPPWECLLKLLLSLAEVGPAVEWYDQPNVVDGLPHERFPMTVPLADLEAQEPS